MGECEKRHNSGYSWFIDSQRRHAINGINHFPFDLLFQCYANPIVCIIIKVVESHLFPANMHYYFH